MRSTRYQRFILFLSFLCALLVAPFFLFAHSVENVTVIQMTDGGFEQATVEIATGATVLFENVGTKDHWPASNIHPTHTLYPGSDIRKCDSDEAEKIFDACEPVSPGESYAFAFTSAGTWRYHDHLNPRLGGEIVVNESYFFVETGSTTTTGVTVAGQSLGESIKIFFLRFYFTLVPQQLEKKLRNLDFSVIAYEDDMLRFWLRVLGQEKVFKDLLRDTVVEE
ncbi:MAG: hypothetical protein HYT27_00660, partial [Parcubacteria group bacterium]|nr:hypothetical protein [Parcubacteria group bacterium]